MTVSNTIILPAPPDAPPLDAPPPPHDMPPFGLAHVQVDVAARDPYGSVHFNEKAPIPRVAEYSFEWWFNYFYNECHPPTRELVYRAWLNPDGTLHDPNRSNDDKRQVLKSMLDDGFVSYSMLPAQYEGHDDVILPQVNGVKVLFRGDNRPPFLVKDQHGTYARARVPALRLSENMNSAWHPYSTILPITMYFRRGQQDACLQTVVSVAPQFRDATKFPPVNEMKAADRRTASVELAGPTVAAGPMAGRQLRPIGHSVLARAEQFGGTNLHVTDLIATRTYVYVVQVDSAFDTQRVQSDITRSGPPIHGITLINGAPLFENAQPSGFRERAVGEIPWIHHLACFMVDRVHYADNFNAGHLIIVRKWRWLQRDQDLRQVLHDAINGAQKASLQRAFADIVQLGTPDPHTGLSQSQCLPTGVAQPFQIQSVKHIDLEADW